MAKNIVAHSTEPNQIEPMHQLLGRYENSIVFIASVVHARHLKMASALKNVGWHVTLVLLPTKFFSPNCQDVFARVIDVSSIDAALSTVQTLSPKLCHVFSDSIDSLVLEFCRNKPCATIVDVYDFWLPSQFMYWMDRFSLTHEALSLADAICSRHPIFKIIKFQDHVILPPNLLLYSDYCLNEKLAPVIRNDGEVHIAIVGSIGLGDPDFLDADYSTVIDLLITNKIHIHMYPRWTYTDEILFKNTFKKYVELQKCNQYFHIYTPIPHADLIQQLSAYDFGLVLTGCRELNQKVQKISILNTNISYSMRIADYLDAGLPVIANAELKYNVSILKRNKMYIDALCLLKPNIKEILLEKKLDFTLTRVKEAKYNFSITKHANRLTAFYNRVSLKGILDRDSEFKNFKLITKNNVSNIKNYCNTWLRINKFTKKLSSAVLSSLAKGIFSKTN